MRFDENKISVLCHDIPPTSVLLLVATCKYVASAAASATCFERIEPRSIHTLCGGEVLRIHLEESNHIRVPRVIVGVQYIRGLRD